MPFPKRELHRFPAPAPTGGAAENVAAPGWPGSPCRRVKPSAVHVSSSVRPVPPAPAVARLPVRDTTAGGVSRFCACTRSARWAWPAGRLFRVDCVAPEGNRDAACRAPPLGAFAEALPVSECPDPADEPGDPVESANATAGIDAMAAPIPSATASAPTRPTYLLWSAGGTGGGVPIVGRRFSCPE